MLDAMRTKAHALIQRRYIEKGNTTRIVVLPLIDSGLPEELVHAGQPIPLDLLAGRPVNLALYETSLEADLCFGGSPIRCTFPWTAVIAAQDEWGNLEQTLTMTVAVRMEDDSLSPTQLPNFPPSASERDETEQPQDPKEIAEPHPLPTLASPKTRPHLRLVRTEDPDPRGMP